MSIARWPYSVIAIVILCAGCKRTPAPPAKRAAAPVIVSQIGDIVIKTTPAGADMDLDAHEEMNKHRPPHTKSFGTTNDRASADKNFAQIDWHVRHACGTRVIPRVDIDGKLIRLSSMVSGEPVTTPCTGTISYFQTKIDGLPADTYRIIDEHGPNELGFDVMLGVPATHTHF